jgi:hypothetical protein
MASLLKRDLLGIWKARLWKINSDEILIRELAN